MKWEEKNMTRQQWDEMTEFMAEDVATVTDYLEMSFDELEESDFALLYQAVTRESAEADDKEELHRMLLEAMYELADESESDFRSAVKRAEKLVVQ